MKVLIAGGGLGGLVLAHKLLAAGHNVTVLERDEAEGKRDQGLVIGLRQEGADVLREAGLTDVLLKVLAKVGPSGICIMDAKGDALMRLPNLLQIKLAKDDVRCSLVDRSVLRKELAQGLPSGVIQWNARVTAYEEDANGVTAILHSGERVQGDVLVGCDGARSAIRAQRTPTLLPAALGLWNLAGTVEQKNLDALRHTRLFQEAKQGLTRMSQPLSGVSLMAFVYVHASSGEKVLLWSFSMPSAVAQERGLVQGKGAEAKAALVKLCEDSFAASTGALQVMLATTTDELFLAYEMTSVDASRLASAFGPNASRVTLLGDAAHLTTSQAGLGATAAFQDAVSLGHILSSATDVPSALKEYEKQMVPRAKKVIGASAGNSRMIHKVRGPVGIAVMNGMMRTVGWIIRGVLFVYRSVFGWWG